jgi:GNAT superfamily N-acetyltransferase
MQYQANLSNPRPTTTAPGAARAHGSDARTERLPFTIRRVKDEDSLRKAVKMRHAAYARHVPEFARTLLTPETSDYEEDAIILLAESKLDGSALGTARLQTNLHHPLHVEESVRLPVWLQGRRLAEVSRLGVDNGHIGRVVKTALLKACVQYCQDNAIEWALATGRAPIDRQYEQLMFVDVFEGGGYVPLSHVGNIPHRIMAFDITTIEQRWSAAKHPLLEFFCHISHPDIDVGGNSGNDLARMPLPNAPVEPGLSFARELEPA